MKTSHLRHSIITFLFLFGPCLAFSSDTIGTIVKMRGEVIKTSKEHPNGLVLKVGDELIQGDELNSSDRSFAKILMEDETIFQLGPKSKFQIEEFVMKDKKDKAKRKATYNLVHGKLRSIFTVKSPEKSLHIKTPTATMGIRGTEILSDVYKMDGVVRTDIALMSGKLEIQELTKNLDRPRVVNISPGELYESNSRSIQQRLPASSKPEMLRKKRVKKMKRKMFNKLKRAGKKGGKIFLHDARKEEEPNRFKRVEFASTKVVTFEEGDGKRTIKSRGNIKKIESQRRPASVEKNLKPKKKEFINKTRELKRNDSRSQKFDFGKNLNTHKANKQIAPGIDRALNRNKSGWQSDLKRPTAIAPKRPQFVKPAIRRPASSLKQNRDLLLEQRRRLIEEEKRRLLEAELKQRILEEEKNRLNDGTTSSENFK